MTDVAPDSPSDPGQDWPRRCPSCGTELQSATLELDEAKADRPEFRPGEMERVDFCPNPDCPTREV